MPEDPTDPGHNRPEPPQPCVNCVALQAQVDWLQGRLDARDRAAEEIPLGTFQVRNINKSDL